MESLRRLSEELIGTSDRNAQELGKSLARSVSRGMFSATPRELLAAACAKAVLFDCPISDDSDLSALIGETMSSLVPVEQDGRVIGHVFSDLVTGKELS